MAFRDYVSELAGSIPRLGYLNAIRLVNRSWKDILDMRTWSFMVQFGDVYAPQAITAGTVLVTQFSDQVIADATASAALNAAGFFPPLVNTTLGTGRQFRVGNPSLNTLLSSTASGPLYNIIAWDGINTLTLDRRYFGPTVASAQYQVYRAYYSPPSQDFLRYRVVLNTLAGYAIVRDALNVPQETLDQFDPQRGSLGDAYYLSPFRVDEAGQIVHEFYPNPQDATVYNCLYQKRGSDLSDTADIPYTFPESLLMMKAYQFGCDWAHENVSLFPELANTNWVNQRNVREKEFRDRLIMAIKQDDEIMPKFPIRVGRVYSQFPLGGQWLQGHAMPLGWQYGP